MSNGKGGCLRRTSACSTLLLLQTERLLREAQNGDDRRAVRPVWFNARTGRYQPVEERCAFNDLFRELFVQISLDLSEITQRGARERRPRVPLRRRRTGKGALQIPEEVARNPRPRAPS